MNRYLELVYSNFRAGINLGKIPLFIIASVTATILALFVVFNSPMDAPDLADSGVRMILIVTAAAVYGSIWAFVRGLKFKQDQNPSDRDN